jgi:hypothetical protein
MSKKIFLPLTKLPNKPKTKAQDTCTKKISNAGSGIKLFKKASRSGNSR